MNKKAMIFAAGLGTRLFPITSDKPKALAEVNGITLLEHSIQYLASFGFNNIVINTHHFAQKIEEFLATHKFSGINIQLSFEESLLDTAGGLAKAAHFFSPNDLILLFNVDIITNIDLNKLVETHINSCADVTLVVQDRSTSRYFLFDSANRLRGWENRSTSDCIIDDGVDLSSLKPLAFNGLHILNYNVLKYLADERKFSLTPFYLQNMSELKILAHEVNRSNYWFDCGKLETLEAASSLLKSL